MRWTLLEILHQQSIQISFQKVTETSTRHRVSFALIGQSRLLTLNHSLIRERILLEVKIINWQMCLKKREATPAIKYFSFPFIWMRKTITFIFSRIISESTTARLFCSSFLPRNSNFQQTFLLTVGLN